MAPGAAPARPGAPGDRRMTLAFVVLLLAREPVVGLPCEGCEAVFEGMPAVATLGSTARIAPLSEPGPTMRIEGTVTGADGRPAAGIVVYAYHTNAKGIYPPGDRALGDEARRHGTLRGWARTDEHGRYRFDTIRPASYPDTRNPAHVHMHVIEPGRCTYYIDEILFEGDPFLTAEERRHSPGRGGPGIVTPAGDAASGWLVRRDIRLGERIPGYPAASK